MNLEEILAIIERIGSDNRPTATELEAAQTDLARLIHAEARAATPDLTVLTTLRKAFGDAGTALVAAQALEAQQAQEVENLLDGIEDPDAEIAPLDDPDEPDEPELPEENEIVAVEPEVLVADEILVPIAAAAQPPVRTMPLRDAVARVRQRPPAPEPQMNGAGIEGGHVFVLGSEVSKVPSIREIAGAFEKVTRSPSTGKATLIRFDADIPVEQILPGDTSGNTRMLDELVGNEAVAAAGGCCSLPTPIRTQNVVSSSARPLRDSLPTIGVTDTGAVTYFPAVCLPDEGAALWLCADDTAVDPEDDATWKECVFIDCPTAETTIVDAVYRCLTIGEFQRRFATEQWMAIIQATLALQSRVAEARLWARMLAEVSTTHTGAATGSFFVTWAQTLQLAADSIREQQRILGGVQLRTWVPHWFRGAISNDLIARRIVDIENPTAVDALINGAAANAGVSVTMLGPDTQFIEVTAQANGALQDYPDVMASVLAPEGEYSFLDGGQFDLGIEIRDLDLARQNSVAAFAESFEGLLYRGCNAKRLNIPVDICRDAAGCVGTDS